MWPSAELIGFRISSSLLWPLDRTTGLHQGYDSCFIHSSQSGYLSSSLPGQLASSGFLSGDGPQLSGDCPLPLSRARYGCEPGEVEFCSISGSVSQDSHRLCVFQGFSFPATSRDASLNRRRIHVLQAAACFLLAGSPRDSLLSLSSGSGWPPPHAVSSADHPSLLEQGGRLCSDLVGRSLSSLSVLVAGSDSSPGGGLAGPSVPDLAYWSYASDVGWGTHLGLEVVSRRWSLEEASLSINARELLALERGFLHFLSLIAGSAVSVFVDNSTAVAYLRKSGGDLFGCSQYHRSEDLRWAESHQIVLAPQRFGRCSIPAQPNPGLGMDVEDRGI